MQPVRGVEVEEHRVTAADSCIDGGELCRLRPGLDDDEVEAEVRDDRVIELDEARVGGQELARRAGLRRGEQALATAQPLPRGEFGVLLEQRRRQEPADLTERTDRPAVLDGAESIDIGRIVVGVPRRPDLERSVERAVVEPRPLGVLVDLDDLSVDAELLREDGCCDVGVRGGVPTMRSAPGPKAFQRCSHRSVTRATPRRPRRGVRVRAGRSL
jgi:hypothetical protein